MQVICAMREVDTQAIGVSYARITTTAICLRWTLKMSARLHTRCAAFIVPCVMETYLMILKHCFKISGDDSMFILDVFEEYLQTHILHSGSTRDNAILFTESYNAMFASSEDKDYDLDEEPRPFLAHLSLHSIHEPHPALPEYFNLYQADPDYLGKNLSCTMIIRQVLILKKHLRCRDTIRCSNWETDLNIR